MSIILVILSGVVTLVAAIMYRRVYGVHLSPDGSYYLQLAQYHKVPAPYSMRFVLPFTLRMSGNAWEAQAHISAAAIGSLTYLYLRLYANDTGAMFGVVCVAMLSGVIRTNAMFPVLTDLSAMCCTLASVLLFANSYDVAAWAVLVVGSGMNEKTAVFASVFAWRFDTLICLIIPAFAWMLFTQRGKTGVVWLDYPFRESWRVLKLRRDYLSSWGVLSLGLFALDKVAAVALVVAYVSIFRAQDYARLVQWSFPALVAAALAVLPEWSFAPLVLLHFGLTNSDKTV